MSEQMEQILKMLPLVNKAADGILRVRELHKPVNHPKIKGFVCCHECSELAGWGAVPYPCDTIQALEGEQ